MTKIQEDILLIYNSLTDFSRNTLLAPTQLPIKIDYSESLNSLTFEQQGLKVSIPVLNFYCKNLKFLHTTYLTPRGYDSLMDSLSRIIDSGVLLHDRVCLSPIRYGFEIYDTNSHTQYQKEGPQLIGRVEFVSGNSWIFKKLTKLRYERI